MNKIFLLVAKSSAGKDYVSKIVSKQLGLPIATSFTTRPKRTGETNGIEYEFITDTDFKMKQTNNEIVEHTSYNVATNETWHYGLSKNQIEKGEYVLAIVNPHGKEQIEKKYPDSVVSILIETNAEIRIMRSLHREENPNVEEICRRLLADNEDFKDIVCDYIVYNNDENDDVVNKVKEIIKEEMEI